MSSSALRREAIPAAATIFCKRCSLRSPSGLMVIPGARVAALPQLLLLRFGLLRFPGRFPGLLPRLALLLPRSALLLDPLALLRECLAPLRQCAPLLLQRSALLLDSLALLRERLGAPREFAAQLLRWVPNQ